jgi:hypothetical protein
VVATRRRIVHSILGTRRGSGYTYQSPPESAREELAWFPAAADAKDAGAMARVVWRSPDRAARGQKATRDGGAASVQWRR